MTRIMTAQNPSAKQLEAELKELKYKLNLIRSAARSRSNVAGLENLTALFPQVEKLIDFYIRRARKVRLNHSIEPAEKIESAIEKSLRKLDVDEKIREFGVSIFHHGWTESRMRSRKAGQQAKGSTLDELYRDVSEIRRLLETLAQQLPPVVTRDLPASIAPADASVSRKHKGRKPGAWSQALGACLNSLGVDVEYQAAAAWLDFSKPQVAYEFATKHGASIPRNSKPVLLPTLRANRKARDQFLKDLCRARGRVRSKKN